MKHGGVGYSSMAMPKFLRFIHTAFTVAWLPLFLLIGLSWLAAPWLAHEHYGSLMLISNEEAKKHVWSGLLRFDDVLAALLALIVVIAFRIIRKSRVVGLTLLTITCLLAIDGLFPDTCYIGHSSCSMAATVFSLLHNVETVILAITVAVLSLWDAVKRQRLVSMGFVGVQLAAALLAIVGASNQQSAVLQYVYETGMLFWLGWFIDGFNPSKRNLHNIPLRRVVGLATMVAGIFALVASVPHVHSVLYRVPDLPTGLPGTWLEQHGIVAGVIILYLARHLLRGERPALWLTLVLFYTELLKYSVIDPQPLAATLYVALILLLITARQDFNRNTSTPSWLTRLTDVGVLFGGVSIAIIIVLALVTISGHRTDFVMDLSHMYDHSYRIVHQRTGYRNHLEDHLRVSFETLVSSLVIVTLWSLFQPRSLVGNKNSYDDRQKMQRLLDRYSVNSEDYFKLWPSTNKRYFFASDDSGGIAYRVQGGTAFMLADPIASTAAERLTLLKDFKRFTRSHGLILCVLAINTPSPEPYRQAGLQVWQIGSSAAINIATFNEKTQRSKWWRWQYNRARRNGWQHSRHQPPHSKELLNELQMVSDTWLNRPGRIEQGFALGYFDDAYLQQCIIHTLRDSEGLVLAFANQLPAYGKTRQASVDLLRFTPEAHGAMPALLHAIITSLVNSQYEVFDLGFVPLAKVDSDLARLVRLIGRGRFSAAGLEQFKNKFDPSWHPDYVAYDGDLLNLVQSASHLERLLRVAGK